MRSNQSKKNYRPSGQAVLPVPRAVLYLVIFLAVQLVVTLIISFAAGNGWLPESEMTDIASGLAAVINCIWMFYVTWRGGIDLLDQSRAVAYAAADGESRAPRLALAVVATLLLAIAANICLNGVIQISGIKEVDPLFKSINTTLNEGSYTMQMIIFGLLVPLSEEIVFRGILYRSIRQRLGGTSIPILIASLIFAVYHGNLTQGIYAFFVGVLLCVVCEAGGLVLSVLLHIGINITSIIGNTLPAYTRLIGGAAERWPIIAVSGGLTIIFLFAVLRLLLFTKPSKS